jgi:hypothetical protein
MAKSNSIAAVQAAIPKEIDMDQCSMIDMHSGVYMLGTRHPHSDTWV